MNITEIYKARGTTNRIQVKDLAEFKNGLTISAIDIVGKTRKGILLQFKETNLQHKCNRSDVFSLAEKFKSNETNNFIGKKINLALVGKIIRVSADEQTQKQEVKK